ncbi:hypothetical protein [Nocardioides sp. TF02-7]|uniref:hypothetical protein n=1 Tax=Nocardioides sp. TF02-7 TaxID=2917724 RepID=UPI001F058733|nr:hypothetical protein [Nocardioides sp. TF02-7]UMG93945.1 hypothetical protein MF408_07585 [Nocardioides sp. TF02-7]
MRSGTLSAFNAVTSRRNGFDTTSASMITRTDTPRRHAAIRASALCFRSNRYAATSSVGRGSRADGLMLRNASSTFDTIRADSAAEPHGRGTLNVAPSGGDVRRPAGHPGRLLHQQQRHQDRHDHDHDSAHRFPTPRSGVALLRRPAAPEVRPGTAEQ